MIRILGIFLLFFISSCEIAPRHTILDTDYGWERGVDFWGDNITIHLDARIGELKIRHVSMREANCLSGRHHHIEMSGSIGPDSTEAMKKLLESVPPCILFNGTTSNLPIYMNSGGGLLEDGFEMGRLFRDYNYSQTIITGGQKCSSSCAIAFMGGSARSMYFDSEILFHAPYVNMKNKSIDCSDKGQVGKLKEYFKFTLNKKDGEFLHQRTMDYCSVTTGWILNADGAKLFGITNT